jgi:glycerol transport system ATP-binding protein
MVSPRGRATATGGSVQLELVAVSKEVEGEPWLTDIDLVFDEGLNVLVGPSRAGKTTLMRIAAGLDHPTSGKVLDDGRDVTGLAVRRRDVAFVYQEFVNYPSMTVFENIAAPLRRRGRQRGAEVTDRVHEMAELLGLGPHLDRLPGQLSGGQQQRVAIARALAHPTRVLVLDEPLANLDYKLREELRGELGRIFAGRDAVVLYSTSEPVEALTLGGRAVVLHEGRVLQQGTPGELYHTPASAQVARIMSDPPVNLVEGTLDGPTLRLPAGASGPRPPQFAQLPDGPVTVGLRPHELHLGDREAAATGRSDDLVLRGELLVAEVTGSATFLHLGPGDGPPVVAEVRGVHRHPLGEHLSLHVDPRSLLAFDASTGRALTEQSEALVRG